MTIGKLNVMLTGGIGGFTAAMSSAGTVTDRLRSRFNEFSKGLGGVAAAISGVVSAGAMGALVKSSIASIDALRDQAIALGVTTHSLSSLQHAASVAGVSNERLFVGIRTLSKSLVDAAQGAEAQAYAFSVLGLDAAELSRLPLDQQMLRLAAAFQQVTNPAQRVALATQLFGRSGAELIPIIARGEAGLAEMFAEAERLGIAINDIDAARVDQASDAMARVGAAVRGIGNTLATTLAPIIETVSDMFTGLVVRVREFGAVSNNSIANSAKSLAFLLDQVVALGEVGFAGLQAIVAKQLASVIRAIDSVGKAIAYVLDLIPGVEASTSDFLTRLGDSLQAEATARFEDAAAAFGRIGSDGSAVENVKRFFQEVDAASRKAEENAKQTQQSIGDIARAQIEANEQDMEWLTREFDQYEKDLSRRAKSVVESLKTPLDKFNDEMANLNELLAFGLITAEQYAQAAIAAGDALAKLEAKDMVEGRASRPSLIEANSAAGRAYLDRLGSGSQTTAAKQVELLKQQRDSLAEIAKNTEKQVQVTQVVLR